MQTNLAAATWNTCRRYSAQGQRIGAVKISHTTICFHDLDRDIFGVIDNANTGPQHSISAVVMRRYDEGMYRAPRNEAERDGCRRAQALVTRPKATPLPPSPQPPTHASA